MKLITYRVKEIAAEPSAIWSVISDIANAANHISGINKIELLDSGAKESIVGLKWRETREWMGKDAVEVMWITDAKEAAYYETRSESHGCIYKSRMELTSIQTGTELSMEFYCHPQTIVAKAMWFMTGWMAKKSLSKVIDQDLEDIKKFVEKS